MDNSLFNLIYSFAGKWWPLPWLGIFLANYLGYFLVLAIIILLISAKGGPASGGKIKDQKQRIYFFSLAILSVILARGIITEIIRFFYYQPRPFLVLEIQPLIAHAPTGSFPSGHATAFFALALAVFYFSAGGGSAFGGNRKLSCWIFASSLFMGLARIFTGVHWPSDILAGALIGLGSAFLIKKILLKFKSPISL